MARSGLTEYTDLGSRVTFGLGRYDLGLSVTRRMGSEVGRRVGYELSATRWMTPSVGLAGSAGHSLPQLGFVVPGGLYGTVGLRLALGTEVTEANLILSQRVSEQAASYLDLLVKGGRFEIPFIGRSLDIIIPERLQSAHWAAYERSHPRA